MATRKGYDIEAAFRAVFHIDPSVNIVQLMEASISVVSSTKPREFKKRWQSIIDDIDELQRMRVVQENPSSDLNGLSKTHTAAAADDGREKRPNKSVKKIDAAANSLEEKFENSARKFQQGIDEIRKRKRTIQVLDVKDVPKPPSKKVPRQRSRAFLRAIR